VEASRAVYTEVKAAVEAKKLATIELPDCRSEFSSMALATDGHGVPRYFSQDYGSEDSATRTFAYYDTAGHVRFVMGKTGAVPSAWIEVRFWFDEHGTLLWKTRREGGEGPHYYLQDVDRIVVKDPKRFFAEHTTSQHCPDEQ